MEKSWKIWIIFPWRIISTGLDFHISHGTPGNIWEKTMEWATMERYMEQDVEKPSFLRIACTEWCQETWFQHVSTKKKWVFSSGNNLVINMSFFGSENMDAVICLGIEVATMEDSTIGCKKMGIWQSWGIYTKRKSLDFTFTIACFMPRELGFIFENNGVSSSNFKVWDYKNGGSMSQRGKLNHM